MTDFLLEMVFVIYAVFLMQDASAVPNKIYVLNVPLKNILSMTIINANCVAPLFKAAKNVTTHNNALNVRIPTF